jgi:hypothetical protein
MYYFLHKHRYWFLALAVIAAIGILYFQFRGDPGGPGARVNQPMPATTGQ